MVYSADTFETAQMTLQSSRVVNRLRAVHVEAKLSTWHTDLRARHVAILA